MGSSVYRPRVCASILLSAIVLTLNILLCFAQAVQIRYDFRETSTPLNKSESLIVFKNSEVLVELGCVGDSPTEWVYDFDDVRNLWLLKIPFFK